MTSHVSVVVNLFFALSDIHRLNFVYKLGKLVNVLRIVFLLHDVFDFVELFANDDTNCPE